MFPVGQSFETSGAAATAAKLLAELLAGAPLPVVLVIVITGVVPTLGYG